MLRDPPACLQQTAAKRRPPLVARRHSARCGRSATLRCIAPARPWSPARLAQCRRSSALCPMHDAQATDALRPQLPDRAGDRRSVNLIPLFDRSRPFLRPDLPIGRAPRADAVQDAIRAPAQPARSVLDSIETGANLATKGSCPLDEG